MVDTSVHTVANAWPAHFATTDVNINYIYQSSSPHASKGLDLSLRRLQYYPRHLMGSAAPPRCADSPKQGTAKLKIG